MADRLCTTADLANLLGVPEDADRMGLLIEMGTAVVQAACGQRIVQVVDDTVVLDIDLAYADRYLYLPERPVTAVGTVQVGTLTVTDHTVQLRRGRIWRSYGWRSSTLPDYRQPSAVTVTYTHGYADDDQGIQLGRTAVLGLVRGVYSNPTGATQVAIDDYRAAYDAMVAALEASPSLKAALQRQYGRPSRSARLAAVGS